MRVSLIAFDKGSEIHRVLNGQIVSVIRADLTSNLDLTQALPLPENRAIAFVGVSKKGAFDIPEAQARQMIATPNVSGRHNNDVLRPTANAVDITQRTRHMWIIDFGVGRSEADAANYTTPFAYVRTHVKPVRDMVRNPQEREKWWLLARSAPDLRKALAQVQRFIVTPQVAKHRLFVWVEHPLLPTHKLVAIARDDDYMLGVLHSRVHAWWSLRMGSWQGVGNDPVYTPSTCFETFPFPWSPGTESADDPRVRAIADAARDLVAWRDAWLNPPGASDAELKTRTLTNLYNKRPDDLTLLHRRLDQAVFAAYGWPDDLSDDHILERLLALNGERGAGRMSPER